MDCLCGFLSNISRDLVRGAVNQLRYPCCFNTFVKELEREEKDLAVRRKSVQDRVDHGKKQTMKTDEVVHKWLKDAGNGIEDVNNLLNKAITKKSCCFGHCPNWIMRYRLGRKLENKTKELKEFNKDGGEYLKDIEKFQLVATLPPQTLNFASDKYLKFESRENAFKQVTEAVKDEEVNMIGLYGMGGSGKTTLAEEVMKIAVADHLFDKVLLVTVSSTVKVGSIQERIASSIQYPFPVNEERDRATALSQRLTQEDKILVILDDVWQILDFSAIGIPLPEHHKGCKVLITTRSEDVCTLMDCQKKIQLQILTDEESWTLFQKQGRISEDTSVTLKHLAREISDECKGLPVAIAAVAGSLKDKDEVIWRVALNRLRNSKPMNIEKGLRDPYNCLQLSYDNLDSGEAKSLFLLCSVFPEDFKIPIEYLIKYAIGLGVVGEVHSYDAARSEVIAAKIKLVSSCLLMLDEDGECVKIHDLVRDVAHFIAKEENKVIKCQLENEVTLEQSSIRYLWCKEFPNDLDCSNLEFLFISTELEILDENLKRMGKLRVLYLINSRWKRRPLSAMSFETLTNLRCLILEFWELSDISFVRYTKKLQSLSLSDCLLTSFLDLHTGEFYEQLTNLKVLEIFNCEMERNNYNVVGRIPRLEELRIIDNSNRWNDGHEETIEFCKKFSVPQTLQCYVLSFGGGYCDDMFSCEGVLLLNYFVKSNEAIMGLAKRAKVLRIENIEGCAKNIIPDVFQMKEGSMNKLNELQISDSEEIECLVDTSNHLSEVETLFSELLRLIIQSVDNLRVLWNGCLLPGGTFQKLEQLYLKKCPKLISLFPNNAANISIGLPQLKELEIEDCDELYQIIEETIPSSASLVNHNPAIAPNTLSSTFFPNLLKVRIHGCDKLKYVFSANTVRGLPQLRELEIEHCKELDQIIEDNTPSASLGNHSPGPFTLSRLTKLRIYYCAKLSTLFTVATAKTLISLEELSIVICNGLKHMVTVDRASKDEKENIMEDGHDFQGVISLFPSLKTVYIDECAKLEVIFPLHGTFPELEKVYLNRCPRLTSLFTHTTGQFSTLSRLTVLEIYACWRLRTLFTVATARTLISLEKLSIACCDDLKHILSVESDHKNEKKNVVDVDHDLQSDISMFSSLKKVEIIECAKLEVVFPVCETLQKLENIYLKECPELTSIFADSAGKCTLSGLTTLDIWSCAKLSTLFTVATAKSLISLEELLIVDCDGLKHIINVERAHENEKEDVEADHDLQNITPIFSSLKKVRITACSRLEVIFPLRGTFQKLQSLHVRECPELISLFTPGQIMLSGLTDLGVYSCAKLSPLFTIVTAKSLISLKELTIENCDGLKHILSVDPDVHSVTSMFLCLKKVHIIACAKVETIFPWRGNFQELKSIYIRECPQFTSLFKPGKCTLSGLTHVGIYSCAKLSTLFTVATAKSLISLEELFIENCDGLKHIINVERSLENEKEDIIEDDMFLSLKRIQITACAKLEVIFPVSGTLQKLENVYLRECPQLTSIFAHITGKCTLSGLIHLHIYSCAKLSTLFTVGTAKSLISLEELFIEDCDGLKHIINVERSLENEKEEIIEADMFSSLIRLEIKACAKLEVIFPVCVTLQKLWIVCLRECPELTSIFAHSTGQFTLLELTDLQIYSCSKLSSLFTIATAKTLVSLESLTIRSCDGLKHILTGKGAHENEKEDIIDADRDLENVISIFPRLETVDIVSCAKLEVIFPLSCLPELVELKIRECKELKQIMEQDLKEDKYLSNLLQPQPQFAKLTKLVIEKCPKLKRVFSTSASISLSNLVMLIINGAAELEQLIGCEHGKGHEIEKAKVELPNLKLLIFMNLLNLCHGIELLAVKYSIVHNCPKLSLTSTTTLEELNKNFPESDFGNATSIQWELSCLIDGINKSDEVLTSRNTSELPLLQISEEPEKEFTGKFDGSAVHALTTLTNLELNEMSSPNSLDISQGETITETNIKESIQEVSESTRLTNKTLSTHIEGINLGGTDATHTKSSGEGILAQGSQVLEIDD